MSIGGGDGSAPASGDLATGGGAHDLAVSSAPDLATASAADLSPAGGADLSPAGGADLSSTCGAVGYAPSPGGQGDAPPNALATTPPMGWNSWNKFGCSVSDTLIRQIADALVSTGMRDAGYQYVIIDDCWQSSRDSNGNIVPDATNFPGGIKPLADYVHAKGLKFGLYTDVGNATCQGKPGSLGHETQDANTYASWGVDFVKEDWCNTGGLNPRVQYPIMRDALLHSGRDIVFNMCEWGVDSPWEWAATVGNLWRTTGDIQDNWGSMLGNFDSTATRAAVAGRGHWNDPDMLEVGNGGMTDVEDQTHQTLWAILAAPLIAGNDIRSMSTATHDTLTNPEVIAVDQDPAGIAGALISDSGGLQVWSRPLARAGQRAVALLNRNGSTGNISVDWPSIGLASVTAVRDLWARADVTPSSSYSASVPSHGAVFLRVTGSELPPPTAGTHWLSDLSWLHAVTGFGQMRKDLSVDGHTQTIHGQTFAKGVGMHAEGQVRYLLGRACSRLTASVGVDDEVGNNGSVVFEVWVDGQKRYDSGILHGGAAALSVSVDVTGANELKLVVTGAGDSIDYDHADWGGAQLTCAACP
jgi:alpha-galactosidase